MLLYVRTRILNQMQRKRNSHHSVMMIITADGQHWRAPELPEKFRQFFYDNLQLIHVYVEARSETDKRKLFAMANRNKKCLPRAKSARRCSTALKSQLFENSNAFRVRPKICLLIALFGKSICGSTIKAIWSQKTVETPWCVYDRSQFCGTPNDSLPMAYSIHAIPLHFSYCNLSLHQRIK